jgi:hypothetical protein
MDHFVALSLDLTMILCLFPSIKLSTIGFIFIKEVGNFIELIEFKSKLEE